MINIWRVIALALAFTVFGYIGVDVVADEIKGDDCPAPARYNTSGQEWNAADEQSLRGAYVGCGFRNRQSPCVYEFHKKKAVYTPDPDDIHYTVICGERIKK